MTVLTILAIFPAVATPYFAIFWSGFEFWRRHPVLIYLIMAITVAGAIAAIIAARGPLLAPTVPLPSALAIAGWLLLAASFLLSVVADRQLGIRVRAFVPFFESEGRIDLVTTGAYGVVRHPIYAAGIYYQLGIFLVTGHLAVLAASAVLTAGALWFTRQEERRLRGLLADPTEYDRYSRRVPALFPFRRPRH